jgi:hypothetical protein
VTRDRPRPELDLPGATPRDPGERESRNGCVGREPTMSDSHEVDGTCLSL